MKKIAFLVMSLAVAACSKTQNEVKPTVLDAAKSAASERPISDAPSGNLRAPDNDGVTDGEVEVKVRLKHGGYCNAPLGVCFLIPIHRAGNDPSLGSAVAELVDEKRLYLRFNQTTALADGTVPISNDIIVNDLLGHQEVVIHPGNYLATFNNQARYGRIIADVTINDTATQ